MKVYGVLLIGAGHIGMEHLLDIYHRDNVRIIGVVDSDEERARYAARCAGCELYATDHRELVGREDVDIVIIATYTSSHLAILRDCLAAGKHVLCEKPIATSLAEGEEFMREVKAADTKVLIAHILRHNRTYNKIRELIRGGAIGEVRVIRMSQNHHAMRWPRYKRLMEDCSPTVDCGVHYYDISEWILGDRITDVTGVGTKTQDDSPRPNYTLVTFRTEGGVLGYYEVGWGETIRSSNLKEFIGTEGRITLEMKDRRLGDNEEGDLLTLYHRDGNVYETVNLDSVYKDMYAQLMTLIDMIENDTAGDPSMDEAWRAFRIALAAEESIESGKTIKIV